MAAKLALRAHAAQPLNHGGYSLCSFGHTLHAAGDGEPMAFAQRLGGTL